MCVKYCSSTVAGTAHNQQLNTLLQPPHRRVLMLSEEGQQARKGPQLKTVVLLRSELAQ